MKHIFDFTKEYVLENDRAILRPLLSSDSEHLMKFSLDEPSLWQYSLISAAGPAKLEKYIELALSARVGKTSYPFIVFDKQTNRYAGSTRFYDFQKAHNTAQLGFTWFGKDFQGTGLNKNCKYLMLSFAFESLGLERVEFRADNNNAKSIAAMKSIGCIPEGVLRSNCASEDGRRDSIVLSILKNEWENNVKSNLAARL